MGTIERPSFSEIASYRTEQYPDSSEMDSWSQDMSYFIRYFEKLGSLESRPSILRYPNRYPGRAPLEGEDKHNAIVNFCRVTGGSTGPLAGLLVGVKDCIPVAGVPMATNSDADDSLLTPSEDAVVVERLLDAGATIAAKTNISFPGLGEISEAEKTTNPHNTRFSPGGSSSGSAAAVAAGIVDVAVGTDAAGSVRIPAAWCGLVGMKPTRGLVPLHGCRDHVANTIGPITRTVAQNAAMLFAMAGGDRRDPLSMSVRPMLGRVSDARKMGIEGLSIGVVQEAFLLPENTKETLKSFEDAQELLTRMGARLLPVSIPLWGAIGAIFWPIYLHGLVAEANAFGQGYGNIGRQDPYADMRVTAQHGSTLQRSLRLLVDHLRKSHGGTHFWKANNLAIELSRQVDAVFQDVSIIVTPTTPSGPFLIDGAISETRESWTWSPMEAATGNTWALNLTGHPALTLPAGTADHGLPTGLQIIGRMFDEITVYRTAFAFEAAGPNRSEVTP